jgi:hypothetical protein
MKRLLLLLILFLPFLLFAGTTPIHIEIEGWGTVIKNSGGTNSKGAMYWNGSEWTTNEITAHSYFLNVETGLRLYPIKNIEVSNRTSTSSVFDTLNYHCVRQNYIYIDSAKQGGTYRYEAIQYLIKDSAGREVVLWSKGTGDGTVKGYFDIYITDTTNQITAFRNDPQWFTYPGMSMDSALKQNSPTQYLSGSLSSTTGWYFVDYDGGADMGGLSYIFHTDTLTGSPKTGNLGSSYPIDFGLRFMDSKHNIDEFRFLPKLVSETYITPTVLTVNNAFLNVASAANSTVQLQITSNLTWTLNSGQAWLSVSSATGTGNGTVTLTAEANPLATTRTATVTVSATGATPQTVTVTQAAAAATLAVNTTALNIGYAAGSTASYTVTSNADWTINTGQSWLSANPASGTGNKTITLTAQANTLPNNRTATVTVAAIGVTPQTITVTQSLNTALFSPEEAKITVYPNPFTKGFQVSGIRGKATLRMNDITGRIMIVRDLLGDEYMDTGDLPAGMYIVKVITPQASQESKLVKK